MARRRVALSTRPTLIVLGGVNGAGKSSVIGRYLQTAYAIDWFNPDSFARELVAQGLEQGEANGLAWKENVRRLGEALENGGDYAFETTLGGNSIPGLIHKATNTHNVFLWYCGLDSPERHLTRVAARVANGGHDIPEAKIRERYGRAPVNLINLMPQLAGLEVYDNSTGADADGIIPDPIRILSIRENKILYPDPRDLEALVLTPDWARAIVEAALREQAKEG
jgi:predicted ABC-type ATPase